MVEKFKPCNKCKLQQVKNEKINDTKLYLLSFIFVSFLFVIGMLSNDTNMLIVTGVFLIIEVLITFQSYNDLTRLYSFNERLKGIKLKTVKICTTCELRKKYYNIESSYKLLFFFIIIVIITLIIGLFINKIIVGVSLIYLVVLWLCLEYVKNRKRNVLFKLDEMKVLKWKQV